MRQTFNKKQILTLAKYCLHIFLRYFLDKALRTPSPLKVKKVKVTNSGAARGSSCRDPKQHFLDPLNVKNAKN